MSIKKTRFLEHLQCNICLDTLKQPRVLPCAHSFCEGCLKTFLTSEATKRRRSLNWEIVCPTGRKPIIPDTDKDKTVEEWMELFPPNYSIIAILNDLETEPNINTCLNHTIEPIEHLCITHNTAACLKCLLEDHDKSCCVLNLGKPVMVAKYVQTIKNDLSSFKEKFESISVTMVETTERRNKERGVIQEQLDVFKATVVDMVKKVEDRVTAQIEQICSEEQIKLQGNNQLTTLLDAYIHDLDIADNVDHLKTIDKLRKGAEHAKRFSELVNTIGAYSSPLPLRWDIETETKAVTELLDNVLNKRVELLEIRPKHDDRNVNVTPSGASGNDQIARSEYAPLFEDPTWFRKPERVGEIQLCEETQSDITGSAFLPDGRIALADYNNNKILFYTRDFEFDSQMKLKLRPWGITLMPNCTTELLVTFPRSNLIVILDYVNGEKPVTLPVENRCYGIATYKNQLITTTNDDGHAVVVRDLTGRELWRVDLSHIPNFNKCTYSPIAVSVNATKGRVYIACQGCIDSGGALVTMDTNGIVLRIFTNKDLKCCHGCSVDRDGNLYICCYKTSTLFAIENTDEVTKHILQREQINQPTHIRFFPTKTTFLLSDVSSIVKIYELKTEKK